MLRRTVLAALVAALAFLAAGAVPAAAQDEEKSEYEKLFDEGLALIRKERYDEAAAAFQRAIALDPDLPDAYYNVACAYSLKGDKPKAIEWFGKALEKGFNDEAHIEQDSDLDPIRDEPEFKALVTKKFRKVEAPASPLETLRGEPASLEKLRGKVVVVNFWRTWPEGCKAQVPALAALQKDLGPKGLVVVGISNEAVNLQEQLADELKINYMLLRQVGELKAPFDGVKAFPTTFILDREGKVVKKLVAEHSRAEIEELVRPLIDPSLAAPPPTRPPEGPKPKPEEF